MYVRTGILIERASPKSASFRAPYGNEISVVYYVSVTALIQFKQDSKVRILEDTNR